uniref:Secreted protein n=1 Tax=Cacopsylla melanoneura TaxID=428564 RepID=A0A8D8SAF1_9HEMI
MLAPVAMRIYLTWLLIFLTTRSGHHYILSQCHSDKLLPLPGKCSDHCVIGADLILKKKTIKSFHNSFVSNACGGSIHRVVDLYRALHIQSTVHTQPGGILVQLPGLLTGQLSVRSQCCQRFLARMETSRLRIQRCHTATRARFHHAENDGVDSQPRPGVFLICLIGGKDEVAAEIFR